MRFEGELHHRSDELSFSTMEDGSSADRLTALRSHNKEKRRYIHRCPFAHCPHHRDTLDDFALETEEEEDPRGIKVSLDALDATPASTSPSTFFHHNNHLIINKASWSNLKSNNGYVARGSGGAANNRVVTSQHRQRAILYMLKRMKAKSDSNENIQSRLLSSILTLEKQVYDDSDSKENYAENLATKLFLIFQELERRRRLLMLAREATISTSTTTTTTKSFSLK